MRKLIILIAIMLLLLGCTTTYYTAPEYRNRKIPGKTLGIFINEYYVSNTQDVKDDLGEGDPQKVFRDYLSNVLPQQATHYSNLNESGFVEKTDRSNLKETRLEINSENKIYVHMPEKGEAFKTDLTHYDFILVIDDLSINRNESQSTDIGIKVSGKGNKLISQCEYYIWDNSKNQVVAYGEQNKTVFFLLGMRDKTWSLLFEKMVKGFFSDTPFSIETT